MRTRIWRSRKGAVVAAALAVLVPIAVSGAFSAQADEVAVQTPTASPAMSAGDFPLTPVGTRKIAERKLANGVTETVTRLGPFTLKPHEDGHEHPPGTPPDHPHSGDVGPMHGPHEPHHGTHTRALALLLPPCHNCYVIGVQPGMTNLDGSVANYHTGTMLHHAVFFDRSKHDITCPTGWPGFAGQRIFASGNERTGGTLPEGFGVKYGWLPLTYAMLEFMNMDQVEHKVYFTVTYQHVPANTAGMREVTPVWLDADNCGISEHPVPEGESHTKWQWTSSIEGTVVGAGGHLHDGGESITLRNLTTGEDICESRAAYELTPEYQGHIEQMSRCLEPDLGRIDKGDNVEIHSVYHTHYADPHAMSIMIAFVAED
ncbi:hypothetical protein [Actinokineospora fastidiosa]|uniref:Uncharacterized protein n=1 Tax=Actinokineospora fastidiosa TaxID=1816 RepID=A0A918LE88_9PSEU|nr:hypothetical protein [Actinokineospora fastidiosa]GGS36425.1 hypothetical protein GCM10010171_33920 [Actinokineospora fastidiosa]